MNAALEQQEPLLHPTLQRQVEKGEIDPAKYIDGLKIIRAEAPLLADAIRKAPKLTTLRLSGADLTERDLQLILDAAATHPELEHLGLRDNRISMETAEVLGDALHEFRQLKSLRLRDTGIDAHSLKPILAPLKDHPTLQWVNFGQNDISGEATKRICETMQTIPTLEHFNLMSSNLTEQDAQPIASAVRGMRNLMHLHLHDNPGLETEAATAQILAALLDNPHPNLYSVVNKIPSGALRDLLGENDVQGYQIRHTVLKNGDDFAKLRSADFARVVERSPLLLKQSDTTGNALIERLKSFIAEELPTLGESEIPSPTRLLSEDSRGLTILDNPATWKQFGKLAERLETAGFPVDEAFLNGKNSRGETWLEVGIASAPEEVLPALSDRNIRLQGEQLLTADGKASPLFKSLIDSGNIKPLFSSENWKGGNTRHIYQVFELLPEHMKRQVNVHTLKQQVTAAERGGKGLGR